MQTVLITGAAGGIGTRLRQLLKGVYPDLRLSDVTRPADLGVHETFVQADLARLAEVETAVAGVEGIVHLGGFSVEGPWETILQANIIGCYNLFEAARRHGVRRIVFASSNHAVGFYPRRRRIGVDAVVRPDSRYGVSKAFGEALGALYAFKHGLRVTCIRIGNFGDAPVDRRRLSIWLAPEDLVQLGPHRPRAPRHPLRGALRRLGQFARLVGQRRGLPAWLPAAGPLRAAQCCGACRRRQAAAGPGRRLVPGRAVL
jgi:uronate dehydrogenase